jgi:hypothetical protein
MSRTKKGSKATGTDYWTKRPGNAGGAVPGPAQKKFTHKIERQNNKAKPVDFLE